MDKKLVVAMSTSCLDYHPHPHRVRILRLYIEMGGRRYLDGQELKHADFQDWMLSHPGQTAQTAPPPRLELTRFFLKIMDEGYSEVLFIAMSSALSATGARVREIAPLFDGKMRIEVFDSQTGTFTEGLMALEADRCFQAGWTMERTLARLEYLRRDCQVLFGVADLRYLIDNGRLSRMSGTVANLLRLKPLIQVNGEGGGKARVAERIMTTTRAMRAISERVGYYTDGGSCHSVFTLYSGSSGLHRDLQDMLAAHHGLSRLPAYPISPVVAAHIGPFAFGVGMMRIAPEGLM